MSGIKSFGGTFKVATKTVGGLTDVNIGGVDVNMIDVTDQASTDGWKEFVGGLKDGGQVELTGNFKSVDDGQSELRGNPGETAAWELTFSNGAKASGNAVIGGYNVTNPLDNKVGFTCSLKITGKTTYTAGA